MTTQIAVRVDDRTVNQIDSWVAAGTYRSRAAAVDAMTRREQRRLDALRDAEIYANSPPDPELEAWASYTETHRAETWADLD